MQLEKKGILGQFQVNGGFPVFVAVQVVQKSLIFTIMPMMDG